MSRSPSFTDIGSPSNGSDAALAATRSQSYLNLLWKVDRNLLPPLLILYLLSFLDRSNIGNARIEGLTTDLGIVGSDYNVALVLFFIGYVIFEVPAQWALKLTNPRVWLPTLGIAYGVVCTLQGIVVNQAGLFAARFFLGVVESGLFPGCVYVFSLYYPRHLRHFRVSLFFSGAALAGAFGGILAYGLGRMGGVAGKSGWAWIFIIEGIITVVVGLLCYLIVPSSLQKARFLSQQDKDDLLDILRQDSDSADYEPFNWHGVRAAFTDPQVWGYAFLFHAESFCLYSITLFSPTIINSLGYPTWKSQLLSTPPYVLAFFATTAVAYVSFKVQRRGIFIIGANLFALIGYLLLIIDQRTGPAYLGLFFVITGVYVATALLLSWPAENVSSQTKRATALGMQITVGNCGAITSTLIYRPAFSAYHYRTCNIIAVGYLLGGIVIAGALSYFLQKANKRRDAAARLLVAEKQQSEEDRAAERLRFGDRHRAWRYQI